MNRTLHIVVFFLLASLLSGAQGRFPSLPPDPAISSGRFGNGMEWYAAENPLSASEGEVALLQIACQTDCPCPEPDSSAAVISGIIAEHCGFIESGKGYRMYRFKDVPVGAELDSLLFRLRFAASFHKPSSQAIIFAGDIKKNVIAGKLKMFADLTGPAGDSAACCPAPADCGWLHPFPTGAVKGRKSVSVRVEAGLPGMSREIAGTVVSAVAGRMEDILSIAVEKTLMQSFMNDDVPVASVSAWAEKSGIEGSEDRYCIDVTTTPEYAGKVAETLGGLLRGLCQDGLSLHNFGWLSDIVMNSYAVKAQETVSNTSLVDRCKMASLRGTDLSSIASKLEYFNSRVVEDSIRLRHFNRFAGGLDRKAPGFSLSVSGATDSVDVDSLRMLFRRGDGDCLSLRGINQSDTLGFVSPSRKKMKAEERQEPVSGGTLWNFKNGTRVLYRRMPRSGRISYSYIFRSGAASVAGIRDGEAGYLEDIFPLCSFGALPGPSFFDLLESNGITMSCRVSLTDVRLEGSAPAGKMQLLLKALAAATSPTAPSRRTVEWWLSCRRAEDVDSLSLALRNLDGRLHPGYSWSMERVPDVLDAGIADRAVNLFKNCFSRSEDALLVLLGEQPEPQILKYLRPYMACFATGGRRLPVANFSVRTLSGEVSTCGPGPEGSAVIALSFPLAFNIDNYAEVAVARRILERRVAVALTGSPYCPEVRMELARIPAEAVNLHVILLKAAGGCLTDFPECPDRQDAVCLVSSVLAELAAEGVGTEELNHCRGALVSEAAAAKKDRGCILEMAAVRFAGRKDLVSRYPETLKGVTKQRVDELFKMLEGGGKAVYISDNR